MTGGGIGVFAALVRTDAKYVQPNLIGMFDLLDQVAPTLRCADRNAGVVVRRREAIDADPPRRPGAPRRLRHDGPY